MEMGKRIMSAQDKHALEKMRRAGKSYDEISRRLKIKESAIRTYCSRHGLTDEVLLSEANKSPEGFCPNCGLPIQQIAKQKPRRFCCDRCRHTWWAKNRICLNRRAYYQLRCKHCGKEFISYGNEKQKYCCHECYIAERFAVNDEVPGSCGSV